MKDIGDEQISQPHYQKNQRQKSRPCTEIQTAKQGNIIYIDLTFLQINLCLHDHHGCQSPDTSARGEHHACLLICLLPRIQPALFPIRTGFPVKIVRHQDRMIRLQGSLIYSHYGKCFRVLLLVKVSKRQIDRQILPVRESPFPQILIGYHDLIALPRHPPLYGIIPHPPRHLLLGIVKYYQSCTGRFPHPGNYDARTRLRHPRVCTNPLILLLRHIKYRIRQHGR